MALNRVDHCCVRVAGVLADRLRLYVLVWHSQKTTLAGAPSRTVYFGTGTYRLLVFRVSNGTPLHELEVGKGRSPQEAIGRGPLQPVPSGARCLGVTFEFDGEKLKRRLPALK
jgi:hypothetical protein